MRITLHRKRWDTVEVRLFVPRSRGGWHRAGTLCVTRFAWHLILRPMLSAGAHQTRVRLHIEDAGANATPTAASPIP